MSRYNRRNKYGNQRTELDGIIFDSRAEARRYAELVLLQKAGEISDLEMQKAYVLQPSFFDKAGKRVPAIKYYADFCYITKDGEQIIEDVKSPATRNNSTYKLKKKMMAFQGNEITEV